MATKVQIIIADAKVIARNRGLDAAIAYARKKGIAIEPDSLKEILNET